MGPRIGSPISFSSPIPPISPIFLSRRSRSRSLAVVLRRVSLAHINPLSTLHWSSNDLALGVLVALPVIFWDCLIMVPSWDPPRVDKAMRLQVPRSVADRLGDVIIQEGTEVDEGISLPAASPKPQLIQVYDDEDGMEMVSNAPIVVQEREDAASDPMV